LLADRSVGRVVSSGLRWVSAVQEGCWKMASAKNDHRG
jgi:hypothetical protein